MKPKHKALVFNFLSFAVFFLVARYILLMLMGEEQHMVIVFIAAFITTILSPKFFAIKKSGREKVFMKILLVKEPKEIG